MTYAPTFIPSTSPTTSLPTFAPSLTGSVAIVTLSKTVTQSIPIDDVVNIENEIADTYGVDEDNISIEVVYQTTGSFVLDIEDDLISNEELEQTLEEEIAILIGVHEGNVKVDIENGVATYTITSDTAENAQDIQDVLSEQETDNLIDAAIDEISIVSMNVNSNIDADILVTIDTTGASNNLNDSADVLQQSLSNQGFETNVQSNMKYNFLYF